MSLDLGKSTLGNAIINLIDEPGKISNGTVILDGINIHEKPEDILKYRGKKIGLNFSRPTNFTKSFVNYRRATC